MHSKTLQIFLVSALPVLMDVSSIEFLHPISSSLSLARVVLCVVVKKVEEEGRMILGLHHGIGEGETG